MRLIDADALKEALNNWAVDLTKSKFPHYIKDDADCIIDSAPTIDAVPVVRCKDCKYWGKVGTVCVMFWYVTDQTDFCSFAERKDDE